MKTRIIALALLMLSLAGCASPDPEALKMAARKGEFPATLGSVDSVRIYLRHLSAGGQSQRVRLGLKSYRVVFQNGSGFAVVKIAVYRRTGWRWHLISVQSPPASAEFFSAESMDGKIIVRGDRSEKTWVLYDPKSPKDKQRKAE